MVISSLNKITEAYFKEGLFAEYIEFKGRLGELSTVDHIYPGHQIISRLDVFFNPENKAVPDGPTHDAPQDVPSAGV